MSVRFPRGVALVCLCAGLLVLAACSHHKTAPKAPSPTATGAGTVSAFPAVTSTAGSPSATPTPTPGATAVKGATFKIGAVSVVVDQFRAEITAAGGVNIRSAPLVAPDNRIGSLPPGSVVTVEGRVLAGQAAEPGQGTLWYFLGTVGSTPQFVYGAPGTLQPLIGSATPGPIGTPAASASPATPAVPLPTPPGLPTVPPPPTLPPLSPTP